MKAKRLFAALVMTAMLMSGLALADTLRIFSMYNPNEPAAKDLNTVAKDFEVATGNKVKITFAGRDVLTKARPLILQGNPPDLVSQSLSEIYGALLAPGRPGAAPLDDLLSGPGPEGQAHFSDVFLPKSLDLWKQNGHVYLLPRQLITVGFFYNKTVFDKYGISVPHTWDELMSVAAKLKSDGVVPFMQDDELEYLNFWPTWAINRVLGKGALLKAANDKTGATWDQPGYLQAAKMVEEVTKKGKDYFEKGMSGSTWPAAQTSWAQGKGAMILVGSWIVNEVEHLASPNWKPGFFPFPVVKQGGPDDVLFRSNGWGIPAGAKHADLAKKFLRFDLQKKYQELVVENEHNAPVRKDVSYPSGLSEMEPVMQNASGFVKPFGGTQAFLPVWYSTVYQPTNEKLLEGQIGAAEYIKQMKQGTISYWKNQ
jgi:raffinose/stachyose/melibiose transport system substrate-binding protein